MDPVLKVTLSVYSVLQDINDTSSPGYQKKYFETGL
jgi:hypothetical protein